MDIETALAIFTDLETDRVSRNYFAQANARYILFNVQEDPRNFPIFRDNLDQGSDSLAFTYISVGLTLYYNERKQEARRAFEKGAEFIEYTHLSPQNRNPYSSYYLLISALAYYAGGQFSKSFVILRNSTQEALDLPEMIASFLRKDFRQVTLVLNRILLDDTYIDFEIDADQAIRVVLFAKSMANLMDFIYHGKEESLQNTQSILTDLVELLQLEQEPSMWCITKLFLVIVDGFSDSSLWKTIPPVLPDNDQQLTTRYIRNMIFGEKRIIELFNVQQKALPKIFQPQGAAISLPTSSGKTRIAELAILQSLGNEPGKKVLYLAPFRSLAYEIETALNDAFGKMDIGVSQLYGNGNFDMIDRTIAEESQILIATPEKAKAMLRANAEIAEQIGLLIIDEGHLLDESRRLVINELLIEELKLYISKNKGKIILLSAILPNAKEIAEWITGDNTAYVQETERVSRQRQGILQYSNNRVDLEWIGDEKSFNSNFIPKFKPSGKKNFRPGNRKEAVAYTALKLSPQTSVIIFIASAKSVLTYAAEVLNAMIALGQQKEHDWGNSVDWRIFTLSCQEYASSDVDRIYEFARYGIICHKGSIHNEVKQAIERLMRNGRPRVILATMTLGQGVNLGVTSVIMADVSYYDSHNMERKKISNNEFWNIAGRAGRAFIDTEGKILVTSENEAERLTAMRYLASSPRPATSGLLRHIRALYNVASACRIPFDHLLSLIAENDFSECDGWRKNDPSNSYKSRFMELFDCIDDILLSISVELEDEEESIDDCLRRSLAYVQARTSYGKLEEDVLAFLHARLKAIREKIAPDPGLRKLYVTTGLPLLSSIQLHNEFVKIKSFVNDYMISDRSLEDKITLVEAFDDFIAALPSSAFNTLPTPAELSEVRGVWFAGKPVEILDDIENAWEIYRSYYGRTFGWVLGAVVAKFKNEDMKEEASLVEELAVCAELGLPDFLTAKIYLAGIRSRSASLEICKTFIMQDELSSDVAISYIKSFMIDHIEEIAEELAIPDHQDWLRLFEEMAVRQSRKRRPTSFPDFVLKGQSPSPGIYNVRELNGEIYLCSPDYAEKYKVVPSQKYPFSDLVNKANEYFVCKKQRFFYIQV